MFSLMTFAVEHVLGSCATQGAALFPDEGVHGPVGQDGMRGGLGRKCAGSMAWDLLRCCGCAVWSGNRKPDIHWDARDSGGVACSIPCE